jgi:hypothetical protein
MAYQLTEVWKTFTITVLGFICACKSSSACLMKLCVPTFGAYMLTIVISSQRIVPFINMKSLSLSLLTNFGLKPVSSYMSIPTPACFGDPFIWKMFFYPFTLHFISEMWFLYATKWVGFTF